VSPDGKLLASGSGKWAEPKEPGELKVWDLDRGAERFNLEGHKSVVTGVAFSPDGKTLASCGRDGLVKLWDPMAGKERATLAGHKAMVRHLAFRKDGKMLATASFDGTIRLWDPQSAREVGVLASPNAVYHSVSFSPDGDTLAAAWNPRGKPEQPLWTGTGPGQVVLWDVPARKEKARFRGLTGKLLSVAFSPDGRLLATGGGPGGKFRPQGKLWGGERGAGGRRRARG